MPSYFDSHSSLDLNGESRWSGSNEEAEDGGQCLTQETPQIKWKPLECVEIAKEYLAHQQKEKTLGKKIEEAKNLTKKMSNPKPWQT